MAIDHGKLSTYFVTFGIPIVLAIAAYIQQNPALVNNAIGPTYGAFVIFIIGTLIYNYHYPRNPPVVQAPEVETPSTDPDGA